MKYPNHFLRKKSIRLSSRSVPANIAEAYRKRVYPRHLHSKLTDSDAENSETQVWLEFALRCNYISEQVHLELIKESDEVGKHDIKPS